jgi:hypothetical protein
LAFLSYVRCGIIQIRGIFFLVFTALFIFPKVEAIWLRAGLDTSKVQWLLASANTMQYICLGLLVGQATLFLLLELWSPLWRRWRAWGMTLFTAIFTFVALATITMTSVAAMIAVQMVIVKPRINAH